MFRFTELILNEDGSQVDKIYPVLMQFTHICCESIDSFYLIYVDGLNENSYTIPVKDTSLLEQIYKYIETNDEDGFNSLNLYAYDDYETDENTWDDYENREEVLIGYCLKNNKKRSLYDV